MAKSLPSRADILKVLAAENRSLHAKEIATRLGVDHGGYQGLLRQLDDLAFEGLASARDGHRFKLSKSSATVLGEEREGILTINPRGFGFVSSLGAAGDDLFVPEDAIGAGMHGDRVVAHVRARGSRG